MKRTTYIIIGLMLAGLVGLVGLTSYIVRTHSAKEVKTTECIVPLEFDSPIEEIEFLSRIELDNGNMFSRISVEMSDSVESPYWIIDSLIRNYVDVSVMDHRLKIEMVDEPLNGVGDKLDMMLNLYTYYNNNITLRLPSLPLKSISSDTGMKICGLNTGKVKMYSRDHLNLYNCKIDSLMLTAKGTAKLTFKDSAIDYMRLHLNSNMLKIDCCDSTTLIRKLDFIARKGKKTDVYLNKANIDTLRWNQTDVSQLTLRMRQPINIVK